MAATLRLQHFVDNVMQFSLPFLAGCLFQGE